MFCILIPAFVATLLLATTPAFADPLILQYPDRVHSADRSDYQFWILNQGGVIHQSLTIKLRAGFYGVTVDCRKEWSDEVMLKVSTGLTTKIAEAKVIDLLPDLAALGLEQCKIDY